MIVLPVYNYSWYVGLVEDVCEEQGDVRVSFMHPKGPGRPENCFFWPEREDICHIPESEVLRKFQLQYLHQRVHGSINFMVLIPNLFLTELI